MGDVRAGLSHHQRPGCPATREGTKGTFDVQGPPLATACAKQRARRTFQPLPHPRPPFLLPEQSPADSAGPPQGMSPSCLAEAWPLSVKERNRAECFSGDSTPPPPPPPLVVLAYPGSCPGFKETWKCRRRSRHPPWAAPSGQCLLSSACMRWSWASALCSLSASVSLHFLDLRGTSL